MIASLGNLTFVDNKILITKLCDEKANNLVGAGWLDIIAGLQMVLVAAQPQRYL